jgi:uncharacterized protein (UPF0335 family)
MARTRAAPSWVHTVLPWLIGAGVGPALVAVPVNWAADTLAGAAQRWFRRLRRTDDLSRLVRAATGTSVDLDRAEFAAVRQVLEDTQTWRQLGQGTVEDLATRIASCLPSREGRTVEDSNEAALTIARGLLEFAVSDLEPKLFQQVLMARLERLDTGKSKALDEALLSVQADLIVRLDAKDELDSRRYTILIGHLKRILDQSPGAPANVGEVAIYLKTLIDGLSTDPWPYRFDEPPLAPAAIEQTLSVTTLYPVRKQDVDGNELAAQCHRLVVLGGPGSGKTWLARRITRTCAQNALEVLAEGGNLDEVELPLFTTCARLFSADGDVRQAVVSSAIDQLGDVGGSRISAALRAFFTERNAPTLLVIDSLDEARGSGERLRQADTLPWRIVLTSRSSSWNHQIDIKEGDHSHCVGEIQPLRYPGDVESFIKLWFASQPGRGQDLSVQLARRPHLQQSATVPLILTLYCMLGGNHPLPEFRHKLYAKVLNRILTGTWRGNSDYRLDARTCRETLRAWAWSGASSDPVSDVGTWPDDVPTEYAHLGEAEQEALNHVAVPLRLPDVDTGKTMRRFIHRSIREHLVAEHIASLPAGHAVEELLPHIWYDSDWEYSAPAGLAMHPQHDEVLQELIRRATRSAQISEDLSVIDAGGEFRRFLAQVADESQEAYWSGEAAGIIGQAQPYFASTSASYLSEAGSSRISNRQDRGALLGRLTQETDGRVAAELVDGLVRHGPTVQDKRQARDALLRLLAHETGAETARTIAHGLVRLDPTHQDKRQARDALLRLLAQATDSWPTNQLINGLARLDLTDQDKRQARDALLHLLTHETDGRVVVELVDGLAQLDPADQDKRQARDALLHLLAPRTVGWVVRASARGLARLDPTDQDKRQARDALLQLLTHERTFDTVDAHVQAMVELDPTDQDKQQARDALHQILADTRSRHYTKPLVYALLQLSPTGQDNRRARDALLQLLARETDGQLAIQQADELVRLGLTDQDKRQARDALLRLLARETESRVALQQAAGLGPPSIAVPPKVITVALLQLIGREADGWIAKELARILTRLDPTDHDKRQARDALLHLLTHEADSMIARQQADGLTQLDPTDQDRRQARDALLQHLAHRTNGKASSALASGLARLDPTDEDKRQARNALLRLLTRETDDALSVMRAMAELNPTTRDLNTWPTWTISPTAELLAAVRQNSSFDDWLTALPTLAPLSDSP